jgi:cytidine deaminase
MLLYVRRTLSKKSVLKKISTGINNQRSYFGINSTHAEVDAVTKIIDHKNLPRKMDLFVIRLSKTGELGESRPCLHCLKILRRSGMCFKWIYYSTSQQTIVRDSFSNLICSKSYISKGQRQLSKKNIPVL